MVYHGVGCGVCTAAAGRGGCTSAWAGRYPDEHEKIKTNTFYHRSPMGESYRWFTQPPLVLVYPLIYRVKSFVHFR